MLVIIAFCVILQLPIALNATLLKRILYDSFMVKEHRWNFCTLMVKVMPDTGLCRVWYYHYVNLTRLINYIIPFFIISASHILMFRELKQQTKMHMDNNNNSRNNKERMKKLKDISVTFLFTVLGYFVCIMPYMVSSSISHYTDFKLPLEVSDVLQLMPNLECCINPFVYSKIHRKIYAQILKLKVFCLNKRVGARDGNQPEEININNNIENSDNLKLEKCRKEDSRGWVEGNR